MTDKSGHMVLLTDEQKRAKKSKLKSLLTWLGVGFAAALAIAGALWLILRQRGRRGGRRHHRDREDTTRTETETVVRARITLEKGAKPASNNKPLTLKGAAIASQAWRCHCRQGGDARQCVCHERRSCAPTGETEETCVETHTETIVRARLAGEKGEVVHTESKDDDAKNALEGAERAARIRELRPQQRPSVGGLITVSTTLPDATESVAAQPGGTAATSVWLSSFTDFSSVDGFAATKYALSKDGGATWVDSFVPLDATTHDPIVADGTIWEAATDPTSGLGATGQAYVCSLYLNRGRTGGNGIYVCSSTTSGSVPIFTQAQVLPVTGTVHTTTSDAIIEDKPWLAVSPANGAHIFVGWTRFDSSNRILLSASANAGATWFALPVQASAAEHDGAVQGAQVALDGTAAHLYVLYLVTYEGDLAQYFMSISTDGGATFGVLGRAVTPVFGRPDGLGSKVDYHAKPFASLAVDNTSGTLHVVYSAQGTDGVPRVAYVRSTDGAATFSAPVPLSRSRRGAQFQAAIATDPSTPNRVLCSWYDTRNGEAAHAVDVYCVESNDDGLNFSGSRRITPQSTDVGETNFLGDYSGIAAANGIAHPCFAFSVTPTRTALVT